MKPEIKLAINHIDNIYNSIESVCKDYETKTPSINLIEEMLSKGKLKITKKLTDSERNFYEIFNSVLDSILKACKGEAGKVGTTKIPLSVFKFFIDTTKENILKSSQNA